MKQCKNCKNKSSLFSMMRMYFNSECKYGHNNYHENCKYYKRKWYKFWIRN